MWWFIFGGACIFLGLIVLYFSYPKSERGISSFLLDILAFIFNIFSVIIQVGASFIGGGGSSSGGGSSGDW